MKKNATFRVDEEMWEEFKKVCESNEHTRGEVLRKQMEDYINKRKDNKNEN